MEWTPTERQQKALERTEDEILYGGARGGGKTDAGMAWLLYDIKNPLYRALVIRQNAKDLSDWIDRARRMYEPMGAVFKGQPTEIHFPWGATIRTGHLKDAGAYTQYQGHEYQRMLIEELTKIPREKDYEALLGSNRSTVDGIRPQTFSTTNPDGDGHDWVKRRFDCENPDENPREFKDAATGHVKTRIFITAKIEDNPHLMDKDPNYVAYLNSIQDETLRRQWREGSWEEPHVEGAYFIDQIKKAEEDGRITSIPYESVVPVDTWWDLGMSDAMSIWFTQVVGKEIRVIDYLEAEGEGMPYYARQLAAKGYVYGVHHLPHDGAVREIGTGKSRKETAELLGISPIELVSRLSIEDGIDAARNIFNKCWFDTKKCKEGLRALRNYKKEYDEKRQKFKDRPFHNWASHAADAFRYFAVGYKEQVELRNYSVKPKKYAPRGVPRKR